MMTDLEAYYNKFNEDKRLLTRHGQVEYLVTMDQIHHFLQPGMRILDIGAGTGRYSIALFEEGYDVTALELVQYNLGVLHLKKPELTAYKGNALRLKRFADDSFDLTLLLGPLYHLKTFEEKVRALSEAKRVTCPGGFIFAAYIMNEYGILTYGFGEGHIGECLAGGQINPDFHITDGGNALYDFVRLEDIDRLNAAAGLSRIRLFSPDGPANHMRSILNRLSDTEFQQFVAYQKSVCARPDLIGAGAHTVDILQK